MKKNNNGRWEVIGRDLEQYFKKKAEAYQTRTKKTIMTITDTKTKPVEKATPVKAKSPVQQPVQKEKPPATL